MTFRRIGLAAAAAIAAFAAPAFAQNSVKALSDAKREEMYCIYNAISLSDDFYDVGDAYLEHIDDADPTVAVAGLISKHVEPCKAQYKWEKDEQETLTAMALLQAASDVMEEYMLDDGLTDGNIDTVFDGINKLSDEEIEKLIMAKWIDDKEMQAAVMAKLAALGFPKDADEVQVEETLTFMELNLLVFFISDGWAKDAAN